MEGIVVGILSMLLVFALIPLLWWRRRQVARSPHDHEDEPQPQQGLELPDIIVEAEKRGTSFDKLLTIPDLDDWVYTDGKSTSCCLHS